jgi:uncharacterized protein involved in exopolysaccharide biosynthesis
MPAQAERPSAEDPVRLLLSHWKLLLAAPLLSAAVATGGSFLITPIFTARTVFVPPLQQQSGAASALASLGALSGLIGMGGVRSTADQYVALLQSANVEDQIIDRFKLGEVYGFSKRAEVRRKLESRVRVALGKKDGLITVEVDDPDPQRAAAMANQHVAELRRLSGELALTETQQRRRFFEAELKRSQAALNAAQSKLERSGFSAGAIKAEPKAAAEAYARLQADYTAAQVRLASLRSRLTENAPEVQAQAALIGSLRGELQRLEQRTSSDSQGEYLSSYRDFKYQETLFDLLAKQFELARLDEAREGALVQVVDVATAPELKSSPKRTYFAVGGFAVGLLLAVLAVLLRRDR